MADADDSYDFGNLEPFVLELRKGYDLVMGNRFKGGVMPGAMPPLHRYLGNPVLTAIGRIFFRSPCGDFHCGMRGFSRDAVQRMDLRTTGMEFASEMVVKATIMRMKITEVPTVLSPDGRSRPPHLRTWRDGWRHLRFLLLYSPRFLFLFPGLLLALSGLILGTLIVPGPLHVGRIVLDVHTMLFASAAVLLGTQGIYFWLFVKVFAISERLLPIDNRLERLFKVLTLESGLITGGLLFFAGLALAFRAVGVWGAGDFGQLDPERVMRLAIPATMLMVLGLQIVLSSFFLSVLNLRRR
jgi:hypothetical protein